MMKKIACTLSILLGSMSFVAAQNAPSATDDFKPSENVQVGKKYPMVDSKGRVRVRLAAPQANRVQLDLGGVKYDLKKDDRGFWMGESDPQVEGFHYYQLNIDGAAVPDPSRSEEHT